MPPKVSKKKESEEILKVPVKPVRKSKKSLKNETDLEEIKIEGVNNNEPGEVNNNEEEVKIETKSEVIIIESNIEELPTENKTIFQNVFDSKKIDEQKYSELDKKICINLSDSDIACILFKRFKDKGNPLLKQALIIHRVLADPMCYDREITKLYKSDDTRKFNDSKKFYKNNEDNQYNRNRYNIKNTGSTVSSYYNEMTEHSIR